MININILNKYIKIIMVPLKLPSKLPSPFQTLFADFPPKLVAYQTKSENYQSFYILRQ